MKTSNINAIHEAEHFGSCPARNESFFVQNLAIKKTIIVSAASNLFGSI